MALIDFLLFLNLFLINNMIMLSIDAMREVLGSLVIGYRHYVHG